MQLGPLQHAPVTLNTGSHSYLTISEQEITLGQIDISDNTNLAAGTGIDLTGDTLSTNDSEIDHGSLAGLTDDDHTQYALLAGRSGGQSLIGGTASGENLDLSSTSNATKGEVVVNEAGADEDFRVESDTVPNMLFVDASADAVGINTSSPDAGTALDVTGIVHATGQVRGDSGWIFEGNSYVMGDGAGGTVTFQMASGSGNLNFRNINANMNFDFEEGSNLSFRRYTSGGSIVDIVGHADGNDSGRLFWRAPNSAPNDARLNNSDINWYLDETNDDLKVRVRYSDGTLKTGTVALT